MANWYDELKDEMTKHGDVFDNRACTLDEQGLRKEFDKGYGSSGGAAFTAWGENWVYFPIVYDGAEWIGSAPRNPCDIAMDHQGGQ